MGLRVRAGGAGGFAPAPPGGGRRLPHLGAVAAPQRQEQPRRSRGPRRSPFRTACRAGPAVAALALRGRDSYSQTVAGTYWLGTSQEAASEGPADSGWVGGCSGADRAARGSARPSHPFPAPTARNRIESRRPFSLAGPAARAGPGVLKMLAIAPGDAPHLLGRAIAQHSSPLLYHQPPFPESSCSRILECYAHCPRPCHSWPGLPSGSFKFAPCPGPTACFRFQRSLLPPMSRPRETQSST